MEVNPAFERQSGIADAVAGRRARFADKLTASRIAAYGEVVRTGEPAHFESGSEARDRWFDVRAFRLGGRGSSRIAILSVDISERRRGELALRRSEERLQQALSAGQGIGAWGLDVPSDRVTSDERFARLYGVEPAQAAPGRAAPVLLRRDPPRRPRPRRPLGRARGEERRSRSRRSIGWSKPDGAVRWVMAEGRCSFDDDGAPQRFSGVSFDVTTRKQAEMRRLLWRPSPTACATRSTRTTSPILRPRCWARRSA